MIISVIGEIHYYLIIYYEQAIIDNQERNKSMVTKNLHFFHAIERKSHAKNPVFSVTRACSACLADTEKTVLQRGIISDQSLPIPPVHIKKLTWRD